MQFYSLKYKLSYEVCFKKIETLTTLFQPQFSPLGKHWHSEPENFSKEMFLRVSLGPMHLWDGLINEVLAYDSSKTCVRKESKIRRLVSKDLNKSVAIANYETESEMKSTFPIYFWDLNSNTK